MNEIDETISTSNPESEHLSGQAVAKEGTNVTAWATAQVERIATSGDYEVVLEQARVPKSGSPKFRPIGDFDQTEDGMTPQNFPVNTGSLYRFRHVSGAACKVLMGG